MSARLGTLLCLDAGTTNVKAAIFDRQGQMIATAEKPNSALRREGRRVEQDMAASRSDAFTVLKLCIEKASVPIDAIIVTAQGDGLWAIDNCGEPVGPALTWLDGRTRTLLGELDAVGHLQRIRATTGSKPTTATQSVQLLWLMQNEPQRLRRIAHALRLKEWLCFSLTGKLLADPSAVLPTWGSWRTGETSRVIQDVLGLERGIELLAELRPVGECRAGLTEHAAHWLGLPAGIPVLQGPGDVQTTLIGLGLGTRPGVRRASIFGTSAIHASHQPDAATIKDTPAGAIVLKFVLGSGYFSVHPCFNGTTLTQHLSNLIDRWPAVIPPAYSSLIMHPFFEPGGERAPYTTPDATGAMIGLSAETSAAEIAWASREALAFIARTSHDIMPVSTGAVALGGGLSADRYFAQWFATVMEAPVLSSSSSHASLRGLAAIGAKYIYATSEAAISEFWLGAPDEILMPETGSVATYAAQKFSQFARTIEALAPAWSTQSAIRRIADTASGRGT